MTEKDSSRNRPLAGKPVTSSTPIILYRGDNGVHEFWESEDHVLLLLRNHSEHFWTAHRNYGFLFSRSSLESTVRDLKAVLSEDRVWVREGTKFILKAVR